ncbi:hypothetical protein ACVNS2_16535 [Paenibacillus caseinilyticus]|uniref:hypothetical protein n=1 Tax=Paenibacillus mucilaginosus TaxID=61624 RepID=UPI000FFE4877|nr:hypothetical protein [Paenibacillus mucilaginosus]
MKKKGLMLLTVVAAALSFSTSAFAQYSKTIGPKDLQGIIQLEGSASNSTSTTATVNFKLYQVTPAGDVFIERDLIGVAPYSSSTYKVFSNTSLPWGTYKYEIVARDGVRASGYISSR